MDANWRRRAPIVIATPLAARGTAGWGCGPESVPLRSGPEGSMRWRLGTALWVAVVLLFLTYWLEPLAETAAGFLAKQMEQ